MESDAPVAPSSVPFSQDHVNASSSPPLPRRRRRPANPIPLEQRVLIELADGAGLMSVSHRTAKRIAAEHPELTALINRRRLFIRAKLMAWLEAGGNEARRR